MAAPTPTPAAIRDFFHQRGRGTPQASSSDQQIRLLLRFDGLLDRERLQRALAALVAEEPILRARLVETGPLEGRWEPCDDPRMVPACDLVEADDPEAAAAAFLADLEVRDEGPYLRLQLVRARGRDALCLRLDHRLCDGGGARILAYRLADRYRRLATGEPLPPARPAPDPRTLHGLVGREPGPAVPPPTPLTLTYDLPRLGGGNQRPAHAVCTLDAAAVAALRRRGKAVGATLTDALLTALVRALQPHALVPPGAPVAVMVSADARAALPPAARDVLCNLFHSFFPALRSSAGRPFGEALAEVAREMARARAALTLEEFLRGEQTLEAISRAWLFSPRPAAPAGPRRTFMLLSNVGALDEARLDLGAPHLLDAQALGTVAFGGDHLLVCASGFRGALTISVGYCRSDLPEEAIERLLDRLAAELRGFAAGEA